MRILGVGAACVAVVVMAGCADGGPRRPDGEPPARTTLRLSGPDSLVVQALSPTVWMHTSWTRLAEGGDFPAHGLIVEHEGAVWLVNTAWGASHTEMLVSWIDEELGLPLAGAIATHFHDDAMGGSPVLSARGVPMWAHPRTLELGAGEGVPLPEALDLAGPETSQRIGPFEVFYPGPAHTHDNVVVWLDEQRILFGGCAVRPAASGSLGNTADADVAAWPHSIRRVAARYPAAETVIPSHGAPGGPDLLEHTIALGEAAAGEAHGR